MIVNLTSLRMSDRFTCPVKVHPRSWSTQKPIHKFKVVLYFDGTQGRISHHATFECAEQSVREFLELGL